MKNRHLIKTGALTAVLATVLGLSTAHSAEVYLQAEEFQKSIAYGSTDGAPSHAVAISNAGFEAPDCSAGCTESALGNYTSSATAWTISGGGAGVYRPVGTITPTEGAQVGFSNGGEFSQVLAEALAPNTMYTLSVDVGARNDTSYIDYTIGLYAGGVALVTDAGSQIPAAGGWVTVTLNYMSADSVTQGQLLEIRLDAGGVQTEFDNLRLDAVSLAATVTMWGYSACNADFSICGEPASPGPQLNVPAGDSTLEVTLRNTLPEATSIMIAGQANEPPGAAERVGGRLTAFTPSVAAATGPEIAVAVTNASFEEPDCSQPGCTIDAVRGNYFAGSVAGWTVTGSAGVFRPNPPIIVPTDGAQVGWSNGGELTQTLAEDLADNTTYTLTVDVGDRTDSGFGTYTISLYAGAALLAADNNSLAPSSGWLTSSISYTSGAGVTPGQTLRIVLDGNGAQEEFDNVRLTRQTMTMPQRTYSWNNLRPGAYLYQSGSHVQLQVQMGLYGALVQDAQGCGEANCAYDDVAYDAAEVLVISEIDPALHDPAPRPANATVNGYRPQFFLVNGQPYDGAAPAASGAVSDRILLRLLNAGLDNRAMQLIGGYVEVLGEDGHRAAASNMQHTILLPAAKSVDALFVPAAQGSYPLFDRRGRQVNGPVHGGGIFRPIVIGP